MFEMVNNKQTSTQRPQTTVTIHLNTWVNFVQSLIRLHYDINTQKQLCLKVLYPVCKSHVVLYPSLWESAYTPSSYNTSKLWSGSASSTSLADMDLGDISSRCTSWRKLARAHNWAWKYLASILPLFPGSTKLAALKSLSIFRGFGRKSFVFERISMRISMRWRGWGWGVVKCWELDRENLLNWVVSISWDYWLYFNIIWKRSSEFGSWWKLRELADFFFEQIWSCDRRKERP